MELASAKGCYSHINNVYQHAEREGRGVGFPGGASDKETKGCDGEQEHTAQDEQTTAAPGVLEILELLLLLQIGFEGFFRRALVLDVGQGRVVLVVSADIPDAALQRLQVDALNV